MLTQVASQVLEAARDHQRPGRLGHSAWTWFVREQNGLAQARPLDGDHPVTSTADVIHALIYIDVAVKQTAAVGTGARSSRKLGAGDQHAPTIGAASDGGEPEPEPAGSQHRDGTAKANLSPGIRADGHRGTRWSKRDDGGYPVVVTQPEKTADGRYVVIDGRRWRASNPNLSTEERQALVSELMSARSSVGHAKRRGDANAEAAARRRVHAAKVALGERGPTWWDAADNA